MRTGDGKFHKGRDLCLISGLRKHLEEGGLQHELRSMCWGKGTKEWPDPGLQDRVHSRLMSYATA